MSGTCPQCGHDKMLLGLDGNCSNQTRCAMRQRRAKQAEKFWLMRAHRILKANGDLLAATEIDRVLFRKYRK